jgi:hypothetical protein
VIEGIIGGLASGIAAVAALAALYYAHATVSEARKSRREASQAHAEAMAREEQLLEATRTAQAQEMAERQEVLAREMWLERIRQLGKLQDLLWEAADIGRHEIDNPPPRIAGQSGTWTRLTGVLLRVEAALVSLERLGGPALPEMKQMVMNCRQIGTPRGRVVSEAMSALQVTLRLSETDTSLLSPGWDGG